MPVTCSQNDCQPDEESETDMPVAAKAALRWRRFWQCLIGRRKKRSQFNWLPCCFASLRTAVRPFLCQLNRDRSETVAVQLLLLRVQNSALSDGTRRRRGLAVSVVVQPYSASMPQRSSPPVDQGSLIALVESVRTPPQAGFLR